MLLETAARDPDLVDVAPATVIHHNLGAVQAIKPAGFDRRTVRCHYGNRDRHHFKRAKPFPVDCANGVIVDIRRSMKQPYVTRIGRLSSPETPTRPTQSLPIQGLGGTKSDRHTGNMVVGQLSNKNYTVILIIKITLK